MLRLDCWSGGQTRGYTDPEPAGPAGYPAPGCRGRYWTSAQHQHRSARKPPPSQAVTRTVKLLRRESWRRPRKGSCPRFVTRLSTAIREFRCRRWEMSPAKPTGLDARLYRAPGQSPRRTQNGRHWAGRPKAAGLRLTGVHPRPRPSVSNVAHSFPPFQAPPRTGR